MKIAVPSIDKTMVAEHFGRARYFNIFDDENNILERIDNESNLNASQGAGIQSAAALVNCGVKIIISPRIGPKAFDMLKSSSVKMYALANHECTVESALLAYKNGELVEMKSSNK